MERIRMEWEKMKAGCANYPLQTAFHIVRPVAAYIMYRMNEQYGICRGNG
jgi:hypothetical protein